MLKNEIKLRVPKFIRQKSFLCKKKNSVESVFFFCKYENFVTLVFRMRRTDCGLKMIKKENRKKNESPKKKPYM